ncbi:MAG: T9SS type A sorting domain-containing protein [Bacteroidetes bacterium]|nr:T9SS type A sorting domain-containing protein [Bacteroidota bacterium]
MKKIYLTIFTIAASIASVCAQTVPTCSLDPIFIASNEVGVWPDSATNFISGTVGVPYVQNITIKVPKDTTSSGITFCFNRFELTSPSTNNYGLPPGLMIGSSTPAVANGTVNGAPSLKFAGNANNCASIYGTPTTAGSYTLSLKVTAFMTPAFGACPASPNVSGGSGTLTPPQTLNYYIINIAPNNPTGIRSLGNDRMILSQNFPNPSSLTTDITFYVEGNDEATVTVYNMLGDIATSQTIKAVTGENKVTINTSELAAGTYIYTLTYRGAKATKRMIVLNN